MEFLLGNPFSTPVGQCLEKATDGSLQSEDWTLNMEICDIINETEEGPKDAIRALKKRLNGNRNYREVMLALTVLETCVKNCGHRFHVLVANRDFIDSVLVKVISPKNSPPTIVQDKVLALIQAWADAFRSSPDLTGVVHAYEELKRKGVEFPMADLDALSPIHTPQRSVPEVDPAATTPKSQSQLRTSSSSYSAPQAPALSTAGPITANSEQIARLRSELDVVRGNTKVMSEMLTEMVPGQEDSSDLELLQELHRTCRAMQQRVVELISRVCNEEVTEELLHVNDDLNNVFLRYERFERYRSGRSAQNATNGVLSEVTEDNLIDLGPGSPAVVSPTVGSTAPPSSLSSQLAGLDLGTESVSGTLSSLQQCQPRDSFDVFAQTRGSASAEQRNPPTYEDPQAVGVPAVAVDGRKQSSEVRGKGGDSALEPIDSWLIAQGMIPVVQPSVMDDIEVWLRTDLKGDDLEEGVTSEEFDKFLEERAKAAEMVPSLPSPPADAPAPASNPSGRKKPERSGQPTFSSRTGPTNPQPFCQSHSWIWEETRFSDIWDGPNPGLPLGLLAQCGRSRGLREPRSSPRRDGTARGRVRRPDRGRLTLLRLEPPPGTQFPRNFSRALGTTEFRAGRERAERLRRDRRTSERR
ncbi:PREDICTED: TOM1-like protein 2 [Bison bison bison]|uniref:TOM1-like protein 2 n=1 Tax=Bison bison bison TaxID=43346 RepID=A0A6P3HES8_BISBB|nr:PREDICTED: TOM1-like protein 2 [Bison bison bison]